MMPPQNRPVSELARESGITEQTLYTWRRQLRNQGIAVPGSGKNAEEWTSEDKFAVVLETAALNATELAEYCRRKGLFAEQIAAWRAAMLETSPISPWARIRRGNACPYGASTSTE
jgi:transposase-like protein